MVKTDFGSPTNRNKMVEKYKQSDNLDSDSFTLAINDQGALRKLIDITTALNAHASSYSVCRLGLLAGKLTIALSNTTMAKVIDTRIRVFLIISETDWSNTAWNTTNNMEYQIKTVIGAERQMVIPVSKVTIPKIVAHSGTSAIALAQCKFYIKIPGPKKDEDKEAQLLRAALMSTEHAGTIFDAKLAFAIERGDATAAQDYKQAGSFSVHFYSKFHSLEGIFNQLIDF